MNTVSATTLPSFPTEEYTVGANWREVILTDAEYAWAVMVGTGRTSENKTGHVKDAPHYADQSKKQYSDIDGSIIGAVGELAVAKYLDQYWGGTCWKASESGLMKIKYPDVGLKAEVRHIKFPNAGMPIRPTDSDKFAMLVFPDLSGPVKKVYLIGWIKANEGRNLGKPVDGQNYVRVAHRHLKPFPAAQMVRDVAPAQSAIDAVMVEAWESRWIAWGASDLGNDPVANLEAMIHAKASNTYWAP